ncbi:hypothetical protein B0H19DRAFT_1167763 [Mycena capillaripes]|nr:hypothetical protein B0H19DRAFT_1167763 [Mycena capillaripes]
MPCSFRFPMLTPSRIQQNLRVSIDPLIEFPICIRCVVQRATHYARRRMMASLELKFTGNFRSQLD